MSMKIGLYLLHPINGQTGHPYGVLSGFKCVGTPMHPPVFIREFGQVGTS
jgi:hypothetical protein